MISGRATSIYSWPRLGYGERPQTRPGQRRGRRSRRAGTGRRLPAELAYRVSSPSDFALSSFASVENLKVAYYALKRDGGHGAGIDGLTFEDLSDSEVYSALRNASASVRQLTYCPNEAREVRIAKGDGRYRELRLQTLIDRTIAKALQLALTPYVHEHVTGKPRDVMGTYAALQDHVRTHRHFIAATDDIRDCFPSAPLEAVMDAFRPYTDQPDLLWLIDCVIRGHKPPNEPTGLDQGSPLSPIAMELLLHTCLDTPLKTECPGTPLYRYVDNLTFLCDSTSEAQNLLNTTQQILKRANLSLKGQDDPPADLRQHPRTVLGLNVVWENEQLLFTIPDTAYEDLQKGFQRALTLPQPTQAIKAVATGWINAVGPALTKAERPATVDRVMELARSHGLRPLHREDLLAQAQMANLHWLEKSDQNTATTGRRGH
jgi:RNA-directed DNA polymerase